MKRINLKRMLQKRNNGGFTLVEVIISCALLSILVLGVMSFAGPVMNMVSSGSKNARATMLAETIDSYIAGCLKNAGAVEVFVNTSYERASDGTAGGLLSADPAHSDTGINKLNAFLKSNNNASRYEVRCIGMCWVDDATNPGKKKLILTNGTVNQTLSADTYPLQLTKTVKVFDDTLYNGLYPMVSLETFGPMIDDGSGNMIRDTSQPNARGYKITTTVYADQKCYNVFAAERNKSRLAFEGATYVQCSNMQNPASEPILLNDVQSTIDANKEGRLYTVGSDNYYYPDTYIYYAVLK